MSFELALNHFDDEDRDYLVEQAKTDNEISKLFTMIEMCDLKFAQMCNDAETKVFCEAGTYDDLSYLYNEARLITEEEKEKFLTKVKNKISELWHRFTGWLKKIFHSPEIDSGQHDNEEVEVDSNVWDWVKKGLEVTSLAAGFISSVTTIKGAAESLAENHPKVKQILDTVNGIPEKIEEKGKKIKVKFSEIRKHTDDIEKKANDISNELDKQEKNIPSEGFLRKVWDTVSAPIRKLCSWMSTFINEHIKPIFNKVKGKPEEGKEGKPDENHTKKEIVNIHGQDTNKAITTLNNWFKSKSRLNPEKYKDVQIPKYDHGDPKGYLEKLKGVIKGLDVEIQESMIEELFDGDLNAYFEAVYDN